MFTLKQTTKARGAGVDVQGDKKVSMHMMITVQKTRKNILNHHNNFP
jgi:hypothetical protein